MCLEEINQIHHFVEGRANDAFEEVGIFEEAEGGEPVDAEVLLEIEIYLGVLQDIHHVDVVLVLFELEQIGDVLEHEVGGRGVGEVEDDQVEPLLVEELLEFVDPLELTGVILLQQDLLAVLDVAHALLAEGDSALEAVQVVRELLETASTQLLLGVQLGLDVDEFVVGETLLVGEVDALEPLGVTEGDDACGVHLDVAGSVVVLVDVHELDGGAKNRPGEFVDEVLVLVHLLVLLLFLR